MKLINITNIEEFFAAIEQCKGDVYLISAQGDRFNLKSNLSKYVAFASIFSDAAIEQLELQAPEEEDLARLIRFMKEQE